MNKFYVYGLYEKDVISRPFYIGKGCGKRMYKHLYPSHRNNRNPHRRNKILKIINNGGIVIPKIIQDNLTEEEAFDLENLLINELYDDLTNINKDWGLGAPSGENNPKYWKNKSRSDETKNKISNSLSNRSLSKDHKKNISKAQKNEEGNRSSVLTKEEVSEIKYLLKNTNMYQKEIAKKYDICETAISNINTGKTWTHVQAKDQL